MSDNFLILSENIVIEPKFYNGLPVVTFRDIDVVHRRPAGTASRNFRANKKYFTENEEYFNISGDELCKFKDSTNCVESKLTHIILLTEQGYLMVTKPLRDELSWKIQKILVKNYFRAKKQPQQNPEPLIYPEPRFDLTISFHSYRGRPCVSVTEMARVFNVSPITIRSIIRDGLERDTECQLLCGAEVREFYKENNIKTPGAMLYVIYPDGFKKIKAILEGREASYIIARRSAAQLKTKLLGTETSKNELATEVNRQFELQTQTVQESHKLIEASKPGLMDTILIKINGLDEKLDKILISTGGATQ